MPCLRKRNKLSQSKPSTKNTLAIPLSMQLASFCEDILQNLGETVMILVCFA